MNINIDFSRLPELINYYCYALLWAKMRFLILWGGAGSGKSVFAAQKIIYRMVTEKPHRFLCVRKVANTIRESQFKLLKTIIDQWGLTKLFHIPKGTGDMTITFLPNGNQILFAGLDDVEKLKSITDITGVWIEEASEVTEEDFTQLNLRLRGITANYKQFLISFNPIIAGHWLDKYWFQAPKINALTIKSTYRDNRFIDPEYKDVIEGMRITNPAWYRVYGLGEWGIFEGQFLSMWDSSIHVCKPFAVPKAWTRVRSMDWGSYRPYCVGWYAIDYDGRAWKYRELYGYGGKANLGTKETASQVARKIKEIERKANEGIAYGIADPACWIKTGSSGPSIIEDFQNEEVYFNKADNDRLQGAEQIKNRLIGVNGIPWLTVFETCPHTIRTLPTLTHDKHKVEDVDTDLEDHPYDETRYFCSSRPWKPEEAKEQPKEDYGQRKRKGSATGWSA